MIDFKDLIKAGVYFGHKRSFWHPKMKPFIWGTKNRVHLIDVSKTALLLEHAGKQLKELSSTGKSILWVGTKKPARKSIEKISKSLGMPYVINRWIGGTLSNYSQIKKAITKLLHLQDVLKKSSSYYTKKELVMLQKDIARLERNIGGIIDLVFPPAAIVIVDAKREHSAIKEAAVMNIPVIAIVDTNTDPSNINIVIPANDDSPGSIEFIIEYLGKCTAEGKKIADEKKNEKKDNKKTVEQQTKKAIPRKIPSKKINETPKVAPKTVSPPAKTTVKKVVTKKVEKTVTEPLKTKPKNTQKSTTTTAKKTEAAEKKVSEKKETTKKVTKK